MDRGETSLGKRGVSEMADDAGGADTGQPLDWRLPPDESHSDWTIKILVDGKLYTTYHVNKCKLSFGARQSSYFKRLFGGNRRYPEAEEKTTTIELDQYQADSFPSLLDYCYELEATDTLITKYKAAALFSLGDYFDVPNLQQLALETLKTCDMTLIEWGTVYAQSYHHPEVNELAVQKCMKQLANIDMESLGVTKGSNEERNWYNILVDILKQNNSEDNATLCRVIAKFCAFSEKGEYLKKLTDVDVLPMISRDTAVAFYQLGKTLLAAEKPLQQRCVQSIVSIAVPTGSFQYFERVADSDPVLLEKIMGSMLVPNEITVSGFSTPSTANGMYERCQTAGEKEFKFEKEGYNKNSRNVRFAISLRRVKDNDGKAIGWKWWFSIVYAKREVDILQHYETFHDKPLLPPKHEWDLIDNAENTSVTAEGLTLEW